MRDDLISREALITELEKWCGKQRYLIPENVWELIETAPTAFDKERMIEQLNRCRVYQFQGMLPDGRVCHFSDVIEIVEKGGIE